MSVEVTHLPTGLTVVTDSMPHLQTASLGVWVGSGSRDEEPNEHGISHLLEHMAFKGTKRRTARQIAEEIEQVGGDINAATSFETTAYFSSVLKTDMPLAVDVLSDILSHPTFDPAELKREQNVIVQEIGATEDAPDDLVFDYLQATAFPNQPMGRAILGTPETVCAFKDQNLRTYLARNYRGPDMVIAATGAVEHAQVVAEAERRFGHFNGSAAPLPQSAKFGGGVKLEARDLEQVHIALALEGLPQRDPDLFSLQVFTIVLGGGMSSRLFQEVREKRGLAYSIYAFHSSYVDGGLFGVYAGCADEDAAEVATLVADELKRSTEGISESELNRARTQIKAGLLMARESTSTRCENAARQILIHGRHLPQEEIVARLDAVTAGDMRRCAERLFCTGAPTVSTIGPKAGLGQYERISARFA